MREFKDKRKRKEKLYSFWSVATLFIVLVFLANGVWNIYQKENESSTLDSDSKTKLNSLSSQADQLTANINKLSTDAGIDEELRLKYGVVKPGEEMIVVVPDNSATTSTSTKSIYSKWLDKVKSFF
ncbi:MAG: septum formation initiator family protein [bacterium]